MDANVCPRCSHSRHPNYECRDAFNQPRACGCDERSWEYEPAATTPRWMQWTRANDNAKQLR